MRLQLNHRQRLYFSMFILLIGAGWIWVSKTPPGTTTGGGIPAPQVGFMAPDFTIPDMQGNPVTLSNLRGQPVLVNIWATWCLPCRAEMPAMQQAYLDYQDQGFTILAVNSTTQDDPYDVAAFVSEYGLSFPILFDETGAVVEAYRVRALPTSFFIDENGLIMEIVVGGPMSEALLRTRIENLIDQE